MTDPKDDAAAADEPPARESHLSLDKIPVPHDHPPVHAMYALLGLGVVAAALGFTGIELGVPGLGQDTARVIAVLAFGLALMARFVRASRLHDDDAAAFSLRAVDHYIGLLEQAFLVALLATIVLVAAGSALSDKLAHHQFGPWWFTTVRAATFSVAMMGAVFATQQQRHLAMDLVSKRLPPRGRLVLGVVLQLLTIAIAVFFYRSGLHQRETVGDSGEGLSIFGMHIVDKDVVTMIPIGAVLIMLHCLLHVAIDVDYLVRGKLPPERARSGH